MHGKYLYYAISALLGVLSALISFLPFFLILLCYSYLLYKYKRFIKEHLALVICIFIVFLLVATRAEKINHTIMTESVATFSLEYTDNPKIDGDLLQVQAKETHYHENLLVRYKIKSENEKNDLQNTSFFSGICRVSGTLKKPSIAKNPNEFDYRSYLSTKKIYWIVEIDESPLHTCSPRSPSLLTLIKKLRFSGTHYLAENFPIEISSLSAALIFGDRSLLQPDLLEHYQKTGIVHLLAISGLHVSLLIGGVFYLGLRLGMTRQFMINSLLITIPIYVVLTGASPSVIRAGIMIFLVLVTTKWKMRLRLHSLDAISLAFLVFLIFNPMVIFDVGFQLSFSVSFAIILSASTIMSYYRHNITRMLVTSLVSQLAAFPFLLYHFFELSLLGVAVNLLYIPLFSFVYLPGLYFLFFFQLLFSKTPSILVWIFIKIISFFNEFIDFVAQISFGRIITGRPNLIFLLIDVLIIFAIFYLWECLFYPKRIRHLIVLGLTLLFLQNMCSFLNPNGEVNMIDVGQGDSIFIQLPFQKGVILIDTGGTMQYQEEQWKHRAKPFEVGRDVVVPFLKGKGVTKINKLILTHGDIDHIGGAYSVINELEVKQILMPSVTEPSETELELIKLANKKRIPVVKVAQGDNWSEKGFEFYVLSPKRNFTGERNSGSITFVTRLGGMNWFFGGDLDQEGEERVIKKFPQLEIDVLKVGHHGSKTSSSEMFLQQVKPRIAFISAGEKNRFGHPHQEVLERLNKLNTQIFRTDLQGAITYRFQKQSGTFSTFLP
ncbi:MAG: DNA internalization-related competence protein ComEC/Rec2 [Bacillus sp. (in: firmicutes)]